MNSLKNLKNLHPVIVKLYKHNAVPLSVAISLLN